MIIIISIQFNVIFFLKLIDYKQFNSAIEKWLKHITKQIQNLYSSLKDCKHLYNLRKCWHLSHFRDVCAKVSLYFCSSTCVSEQGESLGVRSRRFLDPVEQRLPNNKSLKALFHPQGLLIFSFWEVNYLLSWSLPWEIAFSTFLLKCTIRIQQPCVKSPQIERHT